MKKEILKIAVVGPESTGKSTLSKELAHHYQTFWVPEYARYYCEALTAPCTLQDELNMFHGQRALEHSVEVLVKNGLLFCDTTFLTVKIWSDYQLGNTPQVVLDALHHQHYDFYLLLKNDLPWEYDPLRDFEGLGDYFMDVWRKELKALDAVYTEIGGLENRLGKAIAAVDGFLKDKGT